MISFRHYLAQATIIGDRVIVTPMVNEFGVIEDNRIEIFDIPKFFFQSANDEIATAGKKEDAQLATPLANPSPADLTGHLQELQKRASDYANRIEGSFPGTKITIDIKAVRAKSVDISF